MDQSRDPLGDRMKSQYENVTRHTLPRRTYTILRLDGRAFHTFTRGMERPFDAAFAHTMDLTAQVLCEEVAGAVFAYAQSDEISILMQDFESTGTQPWFGGNIQKIVSVAAGIASHHFHSVLATGGPSTCHGFDARVFTIPDQVEVANYFIWRQRDAVRNSISMAAQAVFPHKQLYGLNGGQLQEKLFAEAGINWNDYPDGFKRGRVAVKKFYEADGYERSKWVTQAAPHFTYETGGFLASTIPPMPQLGKFGCPELVDALAQASTSLCEIDCVGDGPGIPADVAHALVCDERRALLARFRGGNAS